METKKRYVNWNQVWLLLGAVTIPLALVVLAGGGIGAALFLKHKRESGEEDSE